MKIMVAVIMVFCLTGCLTGTSPRSDFYTLVSVQDTAKVKNASVMKNKKIGVKMVYLPSYLDKPQMIMKSQNGMKVTMSETNRWVESLADNIQAVLADDIDFYLPTAVVKPFTFRKESFDYAVSIEIVQFYADSSGKVYLKAWWSLARSLEGKNIMTHQFDLTSDFKGSYEDMVKIQSEMLGKLAYHIAIGITSLKPM